MNLDNYKKIVKANSRKENIFKNILISFISGGIVGLLGQLFITFLLNMNMKITDAYMYLMILLVFIGSLLTGIGIFDKMVSFCKCGLIVPTTGFAHAMSASALDSKSEGPIKGIGSNMFKMTGIIILYGIVSAFFFALIKGVVS